MATIAGRGAWTDIGAGSSVADYQLATPNVGQAWDSNPALNFNFHAVNSGVQAIQVAVNTTGFTPPLFVDGVFGPLTAAGVKHLQTVAGVASDGEFGPLSARAVFSGIAITSESVLKIPNHYLCGLIDLESAFDPGAVGVITTYGIDQGLAQINNLSHPTVTWDQCFDPTYAITWAGKTLAAAYTMFKNWNASIAYWNSPELAQEWANTGKAPNAQIAEYVALVQQRATTF